MKTKKDINYSYKHVKDRLKERFEVSITWDEYIALNDKLKHDKSFHILTENNEQEIHRFKFKGRLITFDYNLKKEYITTAMNWMNF